MPDASELGRKLHMPNAACLDVCNAAIAGKHASPVWLDESFVTLQDAGRIARDGLAEIFGIRLNRIVGLGPRNIDGHLHLPQTPGLGVHPD